MSHFRLSVTAATRSFLFAAALIGAATARAESLTYNIVDYPAAETDNVNSMQDKVSGTITISALGTYIAGSGNPVNDPTDVTLSYSVTLSNAGGNSYSWSDSNVLSAYLGSGTVEFTNSEVLLNNGYLSFALSSGNFAYDLYYRSDIDDYRGEVTESLFGQLLYYEQSPATALDPNPWTIAVATPEPTGLALASSAMGVLGAAALVRAFRRKA